MDIVCTFKVRTCIYTILGLVFIKKVCLILIQLNVRTLWHGDMHF